MKKWLIAQGIDENRIIAENYATDTVETLFIHVTSSNKQNEMTLSSSVPQPMCAGAMSFCNPRHAKGERYNITTVAAPDASEEEMKFEGKRKLGIYRDALRAYGLYMISAAPEFSLN